MSSARRHADVLVIGAGPAGLAAAHALRQTSLTTLVVDGGRPVGTRDRDAHADMTRGQGGAGLFSDGKFSFYPSASQLWSLPYEELLRDAYAWTCEVLEAAGLDTPPFPDSPEAYSMGTGQWVLKDYPSFYLSLDARMELCEKLVARSGAGFLMGTELVKLTHLPEDDGFLADLREPGGSRVEVRARRVVVATGRFGPLALRGLPAARTWRRLEAGFRIEQPAEEAFFRSAAQLDPKFRFRSEDGRAEWRTFCACRQGEAVTTETDGLWTVSGRADCPATGRSNVGFNTRILDEGVAERALPRIVEAASSPDCGFDVPLVGLLQEGSDASGVLARVYGEEVTGFMREGLRKLAEHFPEVESGRARLIGPTLEGVGWYPELREDLRLPSMPAWVAGDCAGLFRGIIAAMISGHYAGARVQESLVSDGAAL
ncbi:MULTISPECIES: FAD-binding protein [Streptomyces]|uniref:FAD-binding protein n=1 Tax=Streptomyces TaxID=1883 RepID=UPI00093BBACD|nr:MULTISPECIES: FAD-binding protein [unclassified Streptomyces]OKJ13233.1 hypothetical protein AMK20_13055 [Streptomyces sp. TSRI0261]QNQ37261.1 FAD-binding protein [Streptomyces sp. CB00271]